MAEAMIKDNEAMSEECQKPADTSVLYCNPCGEQDEQIPAAGFCVDCNDYLCVECQQAHKRAKPCRAHVIKDKDRMPTSKPRTGQSIEACTEHRLESLKWYCKLHDQVICDVCKHIDHRHCNELKTLLEISQNMSSSDRIKQVNDRLVILRKSFGERLTEIKENNAEVERCFEGAIREITKHLSQIRSKDTELMKVLEMTCDTTISTMTSLIADLKLMKEKGEEERLFLATRKAEAQLHSFEERLTSVGEDNTITIYSYAMHADEIEQSINENPFKDPKTMGCIRQKKDLIKLYDINVKTTSDTAVIVITGIDRLSGNRLVVADCNNCKVKLVDLTSKTVTSELKLDMHPWDLVKIDDKRIAVTTRGNKKILVVSINDTLVLQETIDQSTHGQCHGIAFSNDTFIVSYLNPNQIEILDLQGTVKQAIDNKDKDGTVRFGHVQYLTHSPDTNTLYLSDYTNHKVISMALDGEILASYTHEQMKNPYGISVGGDGRVFVCCFSSHTVFELSPDLKKGYIILDQKDGISSPFGIMYSEENQALFVCYYTDKISVFRV